MLLLSCVAALLLLLLLLLLLQWLPRTTYAEKRLDVQGRGSLILVQDTGGQGAFPLPIPGLDPGPDAEAQTVTNNT